MFATVAKLGAGSKLFYENPSAPGAFLLLDNARAFGQTGSQGEFVETTPISKKVREYIRGLKTPPQKQFTFNHHTSDNYREFLALVDDDNVDNIKMRIDYESGDRAEFTIVPNGRVMDEATGDAQLQMLVFGQQTGDAVWSEF